MNNRNCKPSLRLVDGGPSPWSIRGMVNALTAPSAPPETITQKYARQDAERAAKAAAAAPAPTPAPTPAPGAGISGYAGNTALQAREKAAGLRDGGDLRTGLGGEVPGRGRGDKIDAKYEPGEFVVSNAMLKKAPGLREQLHELREEVLGQEGKSVEEADAEAVGGKTLRAIDGVFVDERPWDGARDGRLFANQPGPGNPNVGPGGSAEARAFRAANTGGGYEGTTGGSSGAQGRVPGSGLGQTGAPGTVGEPAALGQTGRAGAAGAGRSGVLGTVREGVGSFRAGVGAQPGAVSKAAYLAGRTFGPTLGALGPAALGADVVSHFNDYKINDPDVDSSAVGTFKALGNGDFSGARRSFSKGALEAGMDLGSFGANMLDYVVPGKAPVSTAYDGMLRQHFGDQLLAHPSVTAQPNTPSLRDPTAQTFTGAPGPMGPQVNPDAPSLRGRPGTDVLGAPGVSKFTENGRTLYSNVAGDNAAMLDKRQVGIVPGMPQAQIDKTLTNPDGSRWSAADNATMAANLRDGIDPYRGTSRQKGEDEAAQIKGMRELAFSKQGTPGRLGAMKMFADQQQQQTLRQGQDLQYKAAMYGHELTADVARARQNYEMGKDQRDYAAGRYDKGLDQSDKARDAGAKEFLVYDPATGKPNDALSAARYDAVRKVMPGADIMSPEGRSKNLPEMKAIASIYDRIAANPQMGFDKINPLEPKGPGLDAMPNWKGAKLVRQGLAGAATPGSSVSGYYISHNGRDIPLGTNLSERELDILDHVTKTGNWAGAPTNTQRGK